MNEPIRVLHVVVNMNRGGAETFLMNVYRTLDKGKIQFDFLTCNPGVFDGEINSLGGRLFKMPFISTIGPIKYSRSLFDFFTAHPEYKIVHSHLDKMSGLVLSEAKKAGIPVRIAHGHSTRSEGGFAERFVKHHYGELLSTVPTDRFACSPDAAAWLFPAHQADVRIVLNGIDEGMFQFSASARQIKRKALGIDENQKVLIHIGRFDKGKNHSFILECFSNLIKKDRNCLLFLIGDGPLREKTQEHANAVHLDDRVKFLGMRDDVPSLLMAADLLVFPSLFEGVSLVLIEAQTSGLPCLISDRLSAESVIRDDLVTALPIDNPALWADTILEFFGDMRKDTRISFHDPNFDIVKITKELEKFYLSSRDSLL
jgi:glycosyltransferase involved in cell wall biosynthesis